MFRWLLVRNLLYHWRGNLAVLLGVTVGTAVLTGALLVGDSLRGCLEGAESRVQIDGLALEVGPFLPRRLGKARQGTRGRIDRGRQSSQPERSVEP